MAQAHQFKVGDIDCSVLLEGARTTDDPKIDDLKGRYPNATDDELNAALHGVTLVHTSLNPFYINAGGTKILADTGFGVDAQPEMGGVIPALESIGVKPEDIDIIYLTHFHGDHIAGLMDKDNNVVYSNARYMTTSDEWDEWMGKWKDSDDEGHQKNYQMMQSLHDKFVLLSEGDEVADGVSVVAIAGHTLGQSALLVESNGESVIHVADVLHNKAQFKYTNWHFRFDSDAELAVKTRNSILKRCADEGLLTLFYHLKFPGLGHVKADGDGFSWHPID